MPLSEPVRSLLDRLHASDGLSEEAKAALEDLRKALEDSSESSRQLLHELRNLLSAWVQASEKLVQSNHPEETSLLLSALRADTQYYSGLLQKRMRSETDRPALEYETLWLERSLEAQWLRLSPQLPRQQLEIGLELDPALYGPIRSPKGLASTVLGNLLSNAVKYTVGGSIVVRGRLRKVEAQSLLELEVEDTGLGWPQDRKPEQQLEGTELEPDALASTLGTDSMGIGAGVVNRSLAQVGGGARIMDAPGGGTRVRVWWPVMVVVPLPVAARGTAVVLAPAALLPGMSLLLRRFGYDALCFEDAAAAQRQLWDAPAPDVLLADAELRGSHDLAAQLGAGLVIFTSWKPPDAGPKDTYWVQKPLWWRGVQQVLQQGAKEQRSLNPPQPHWLVVEDQEFNRVVMLAGLQSLGYAAQVAENGLEAVLALEAGGVQGMILDWNMPVMNGRELLHHMAETQCSVPVVVLSVDELDAAELKALYAGVRAVLTKSHSLQEVMRWLTDRPPQGNQVAEPEPVLETRAVGQNLPKPAEVQLLLPWWYRLRMAVNNNRHYEVRQASAVLFRLLSAHRQGRLAQRMMHWAQNTGAEQGKVWLIERDLLEDHLRQWLDAVRTHAAQEALR